MKIHEYQGKEILRQFDVPVPRGYPAFNVQEALEAAQKLGVPMWSRVCSGALRIFRTCSTASPSSAAVEVMGV